MERNIILTRSTKKHWCPKGCGKKVKYTSWHPVRQEWCKRGLYCTKCGNYYIKEELILWKKNQ